MWWIFVSVLLIYWFYHKFIKVLSYWKDKGVHYGDANVFFGMSGRIFLRKVSVYDLFYDLYNKFPGRRYYGSFSLNLPVLIIKEIELIKNILVKDFDHFTDHTTQIDANVDVLFAKNLTLLKGEQWKDMRSTLSPVFTSSKMKLMFHLINDCSREFLDYYLKQSKTILEAKITEKSKTKITEKEENVIVEVEMKDTISRFANDVIASVAFGIKCDSLTDKNNNFFKMGQTITNIFSGWTAIIKLMIIIFSKTLTRLFKIRLLPEASDFFESIVTKTIKKREELNIIRPDMLHLLMESKKGRLQYEEDYNEENATGFATVNESHLGKSEKNVKPPITDLDIAAQALLFFFAGFDTVSTTLSFLTYELAINPDVQEKLQNEIDDGINKTGDVTYDRLLKMKYMDMVVSESLRKWPAAAALDRVCVKEYTIPSVSDDEKDITLKTGLILAIPILGLHRDPKFYPNPMKFDPERFSDENKHLIQPYTYLPFGVGPRNCIGSRFALLEIKLLLFHLLSKFDLVPIEKTVIPLKLSTKNFKSMPDNGFWIGLKLRNDRL